VVHGSATVEGSLTAVAAPVTDVVVCNGRVALRAGAIVTGDVVAQDPLVAAGATIGRERRRLPTNRNWAGFGWAGRTGIGPAIGWGWGWASACRSWRSSPWSRWSVSRLGWACWRRWAALGDGASAWIVGRRVLREPAAWVLALLVGWGSLRVAALIPVLGGLVWFAAVAVGLGALLVASWRARTTSPAAQPNEGASCQAARVQLSVGSTARVA
jgi:hypothetical protein